MYSFSKFFDVLPAFTYASASGGNVSVIIVGVNISKSAP